MSVIPGEDAPEECESTRLTALHRTSSGLLAESTIPQQLSDGFDRSGKRDEGEGERADKNDVWDKERVCDSNGWGDIYVDGWMDTSVNLLQEGRR